MILDSLSISSGYTGTLTIENDLSTTGDANISDNNTIAAGQTMTFDVQMTRTVLTTPSLDMNITTPADGAEVNNTPVTVSGYLNNLEGNGGYGESWAQSFKPISSGPLDSISLLLRRIGAPDDELFVRITTEIGGIPIAESGGVSAGSIGDVTAEWRNFSLSSPPDVTAGNTYYIELWREKKDSNNYIEWFKLNADAYADGKIFDRKNGLWSSNYTKEFTFKVYVNSALDIEQNSWSADTQPELYGYDYDPVTVYVNGVPATVDNITFFADVPLNEGQNTITATVTQGSQEASDIIDIMLVTKGSIAGTVIDSTTGLPLQSAYVSVTDALT